MLIFSRPKRSQRVSWFSNPQWETRSSLDAHPFTSSFWLGNVAPPCGSHQSWQVRNTKRQPISGMREKFTLKKCIKVPKIYVHYKNKLGKKVFLNVSWALCLVSKFAVRCVRCELTKKSEIIYVLQQLASIALFPEVSNPLTEEQPHSALLSLPFSTLFLWLFDSKAHCFRDVFLMSEIHTEGRPAVGRAYR